MENCIFFNTIRNDYEKDKSPKNYNIYLYNGEKIVLRTFFSTEGSIGYFGKKKRTKGYHLSYWPYVKDVQKFELIEETKKDINDILFKRAKKRMLMAKKILEKSELWPEILEEINNVLSMGDNAIMEIIKAINEDSFAFYCETKENGRFNFIKTHQLFTSFVNAKCWLSVPYKKHGEENIEEIVKSAIECRRDYYYRWNNRYRFIISVKKSIKDEQMRGYLTAQCQNGKEHYYILLDERHAIYYEDD